MRNIKIPVWSPFLICFLVGAGVGFAPSLLQEDLSSKVAELERKNQTLELEIHARKENKELHACEERGVEFKKELDALKTTWATEVETREVCQNELATSKEQFNKLEVLYKQVLSMPSNRGKGVEWDREAFLRSVPKKP